MCAGTGWSPPCCPGACGCIPVYVRRVCVDLMRLGVLICVGLLCLLRGCIELEFGLVSLGLHCFFAVILCWVDCSFGSSVLLRLLSFLHVTQQQAQMACVVPCNTMECTEFDTPTSNNKSTTSCGKQGAGSQSCALSWPLCTSEVADAHASLKHVSLPCYVHIRHT